MVDGHEKLPYVKADINTLREADFLPFKLLADLPMSMTAHITYSTIDTLPATISKKMITIIRKDIKFKNLLITDDISMGALTGSISKRAELSIKAGCDIVLHCNGQLTEMIDVANACGSLSEQSEKRSEFVLSRRKPVRETNVDEFRSEFIDLMNVLSDE